MKTTIQITGETLQRLKNIKLTKRESYDEIINRLIEK
jgi:predicted CopG family antitoxin